MEVCENFKKQVEEKVEKPMDEWVEKREEKCKKGKWYNPLTWICWFVATVVKVVRWVVVTVLKWVTYVVCKIVTYVFLLLGFLVDFLKSLPILGAIVNFFHQFGTAVLNAVRSIIPAILDALGIKYTKYLRIHIIRQRNEKGNPLISLEQSIEWIEKTKEVFKQANVEVFVEVVTINHPSHIDNLYIRMPSEGKWDMFLNNFTLWMARFRRYLALWDFSGAPGRFLGIGASLACFVVEDIQIAESKSGNANKLGFSWGPFEDFVIVARNAHDDTLAHEVGHSCWLDHDYEDASNLMFTPGRTGNTLTKKQIFFIRNSKYVSML